MTKHQDHHHEAHNHEHGHDHHHGEGHGHTHGLVDESIIRSRAGVKAVSISFLVLFITSLIQAGVYLSSHSVALLADLIHNFGDALTAIPLGLAFWLHSKKGERMAGYFIVVLIFLSACVTIYEAISRFIHPLDPSNLWALLIAGVIGVIGNEIAAVIRWRAGKRLNSPALIADGNHARADGIVSAGVILGAILLALGLHIADPIIGVLISLLILKSSWDSWRTIKESH